MAIQDKVKFGSMRSVMFFGLIGILTVAMLYLFLPFFYPIFWAAVIAIIFYPLYELFNRYIRWKGLNATLMLLVILAVLIIPLMLLALLVANESVKLVSQITQSGFVSNTQEVSLGFTTWVEKTALAPYMETLRDRWTEYAKAGTNAISSYSFHLIKSVTQNSFRFVFMFLLMLYTLFYLFKDGEKITKRVMHLSPLGDKYEQMLFNRFTSTTRATLKGTFIVGGIQGAIGGILFWITGVPGALVWAVIMTALSIIPAVGAFIIWLPAGLLMLGFGLVWQGLTILIVGTVLISNIDNILRPIIVGRDIEMHPVVVLFSTLGGIFIFGISGFIIGPIIAALYLAVISIYDHYYSHELDNN